MMQGITALLVDLDGTLVDSVPDIADALDRMLAGLGMAAVGEEQVRLWVGSGSARLVERALTLRSGRPPAATERDAALARFLDAYGQRLWRRSRLYPGVREGLDRLRADGYRLACVTNKPEALAVTLLDAIGFGSAWFPVVVGGDTLAVKKPDPAPLHHAMNALGVTPAQTLMVGDSVTDARAARSAGIGLACVPYGYNHGVDIREAEPDMLVDNLVELHRLLRQAA